ncbi:MAG: hypothetical protein LIP28_02385, partial [Deltaproteobacteria bacterium]|nr:hypothetical protein [Deltaproteobacteria bacterium]
MKNFERFRAPVPSNENPDPGNKPSFLQPTSLVVLWACLLGLCSLFARTGVAGQIPVAALTLLACLIARNAGPVLPGFLGACSAAALGVFLENLGSVSMGAGAILYFLL